jgi:hypothetical protein
MYDSSSWPFLAGLLAFLESQASPTTLGTALEALWRSEGYIAKRGFPRYPNYVKGFPAVACSDSDNPDSYAAWSDAGAAADDEFGYFGRIWTWVSSICAAWPGADGDRYTGPFNHHTGKPVLVVGNLFDPATRYQGADRRHGLRAGRSTVRAAVVDLGPVVARGPRGRAPVPRPSLPGSRHPRHALGRESAAPTGHTTVKLPVSCSADAATNVC